LKVTFLSKFFGSSDSEVCGLSKYCIIHSTSLLTSGQATILVGQTTISQVLDITTSSQGQNISLTFIIH
jgi:hypothetical protein